MKIAVFIKQVPDTNNVQWTENNNIDRTRMDSILNPADKQAIEAALRIKEINNSHITAITMGPNKAVEVLKESVAMGVDDAILLCDSKFAGSDTLATSKILSSAITQVLPETNLLIFGQTAIDGETGQTGACVATRLNMPFVSNVSEITEINETHITVISNTDEEQVTQKIELPCAICINNYVFQPRLPRIQGYITSQKYIYNTYNIYDLGVKEDEAGLKGSPTYVSKVYKNEETRNGITLDRELTDIKQIYEEIKKVL